MPDYLDTPSSRRKPGSRPITFGPSLAANRNTCVVEHRATAQRGAAPFVHRYGFVAPHPNPSPDGRGAQERRHSSERWNPFFFCVWSTKQQRSAVRQRSFTARASLPLAPTPLPVGEGLEARLVIPAERGLTYPARPLRVASAQKQKGRVTDAPLRKTLRTEPLTRPAPPTAPPDRAIAAGGRGH